MFTEGGQQFYIMYLKHRLTQNVAVLYESAVLRYLYAINVGGNYANSIMAFNYRKYGLSDDDLILMGYSVLCNGLEANKCGLISMTTMTGEQYHRSLPSLKFHPALRKE